MLQPWRLRVILLIVTAAVLGLTWRMISLNLLQRDFLVKENSARTSRTVSIPAYRGVIEDRHGQPLAISTPVDSAWINPQVFKPSAHQLQQLAELLDMPAKTITERAANNPDRQFLYIKRLIPPSVSEQIQELKIAGIHFQREFKRFYPTGEVTAHVIGFTNVDDHGQEGLELSYNKSLRGIPGKKQVIKDRLGQIVTEVAILSEPQQGQDLQLTIDSRIQYIAHQALQEGLAKHKASSGSAIVLDVNTGEIIAMTNLPSYNPNNPPDKNEGQFRNRAFTDVFEPGSTMKVFTMLNALASGQYDADTPIDTGPGHMTLNGRTFRDTHKLGLTTFKEVLQHSSNVGVTKITLSLPEQSLWTLLNVMGFGRATGANFPGESFGQLAKRSKWKPIELATLSFGYGLSATPAQLIRAYSILATGGKMRPITFIKGQKNEATRVITQPLAEEMLGLMESSGQLVQIPGYRIAGKTGTSFIMGPNGYLRNRYISSFIGIAPASKPQLIVAVFIVDPRAHGYYGAQVAAPVFSTIMAGSLRLMNIAPDSQPEVEPVPEV